MYIVRVENYKLEGTHNAIAAMMMPIVSDRLHQIIAPSDVPQLKGLPEYWSPGSGMTASSSANVVLAVEPMAMQHPLLPHNSNKRDEVRSPICAASPVLKNTK